MSSTSGATQRFLYDGDALVAEYDGSGSMTHRYAHWAGADVPMLSYAGSALTSPRHLFADQQGSIVAATDGSGATSWINAYDEYGVPAAGNSGRFQYTGQAWLPELGLYHYKARIYGPREGRFWQTDPVGYQDQFNLYAYVADDPINNVDPDGKQIGWRHSPFESDEERDRKVEFNESAFRGLRGAEIEAHNTLAQILASLIPVEKGFVAAQWAARLISASRAGSAFLRSASAAYRTAAAGGRMAGELRQLVGMTPRQLRSTIASREATIAEHLEKIRNPASHMTRESATNAESVARARRDWQRTVDRASAQRDIARDELRRRSYDE